MWLPMMLQCLALRKNAFAAAMPRVRLRQNSTLFPSSSRVRAGVLSQRSNSSHRGRSQLKRSPGNPGRFIEQLYYLNQTSGPIDAGLN